MTVLRLNPKIPAPNVPAIRLDVGQSKTVGRGRQADVIVDDASLSRLHARMAVDQDGQLSIDDLGSTNGVFVNGAEQLSAYLTLGDTVRFGRVEYVVGSDDETTPMEEAPVVSQTILRRLAISEAPKVDKLALEALLATSREMMAFEDLPALLERVLDRLSSILKSDRAAILLVDAAMAAAGSPQPDFFALKLMSYLDGVLTAQGGERMDTPVAVILSKADYCPECFDDPHAFTETNLNRLWNICHSRFKNFEFFPTSVVGALGYGSDEAENVIPYPLHIAPRGVIEPFEWILRNL